MTRSEIETTLPYYFSVKTEDGVVTWKCIAKLSGKPIARSPRKYATIHEAREGIKLFQEVVRNGSLIVQS